MKQIVTEAAPPALGPYSQAILHEGMLFVSGQLGIDPHNHGMPPNFIEQAHLVFNNLKAILKEAGMDFSNVVKVSVFLKDMEDFASLNHIYASQFREPFPAREAVQVARLPKDGLVEISLIAMK
jgi:2-iminobutanoate/2-iminopropanoate deaminase